jgi:hypothetical protein
MSGKQTKAAHEPVGNLCVVRDEELTGWSVLICPGVAGARKPLARFSTRSQAEEFANAEMIRLNKGGDKKFVLHVDDCPCWQKQL